MIGLDLLEIDRLERALVRLRGPVAERAQALGVVGHVPLTHARTTTAAVATLA